MEIVRYTMSDAPRTHTCYCSPSDIGDWPRVGRGRERGFLEMSA
jgi:hypothetical protein